MKTYTVKINYEEGRFRVVDFMEMTDALDFLIDVTHKEDGLDSVNLLTGEIGCKRTNLFTYEVERLDKH